jgi:hypothetical protein
MEAGGRDKIMLRGITTTLPYPSQDKAERIRERKILILNYQANAGMLRKLVRKGKSETLSCVNKRISPSH